jgi:hypothetical protein
MMFQNPEKLNLMIFDRLGKQVFSKEYAETTLYNEVIDIKNWADGMYVIKLIIGDNQTSYWKLLVMK